MQLCTCITLFCAFLGRHCTYTTWNFMEDVNKRGQFFLFISKIGCSLQEINSREIRLHLTFSANWNKRDKVWKLKREFIFLKWRSRCRCRRKSSLILVSHRLKPCANRRNIVGSCCVRLHLDKRLTVFKLCLTTCNRVCKRTQHVPSNNVASVCTGRKVTCTGF